MDSQKNSDSRENHILGVLNKSEFEILTPHLELATLSRSEVLFEAYEELQYVYFSRYSYCFFNVLA